MVLSCVFKVAFSGVYANMRMVHVLTSVVVSQKTEVKMFCLYNLFQL